METTEDVRPFSYAGFTKDEIRRVVDERRAKVLPLILQGLTRKEVAEELQVSKAVIMSDVRALIEDGVLTRGEVKKAEHHRRWTPTSETIILVCEMLRKAKKLQGIADVVGINVVTLSKWLKASEDTQVLAAVKAKQDLRKPQTKHTPLAKLYDEVEAEALELFGKSLNEMSDENHIWMIENGYNVKSLNPTSRNPRGRAR